MNRILVVDDDLRSLTYIFEMLEFEGFSIQSAASGEEALSLIFADPPDVALVDVLMPGMSGLDLLSALRADPRTRDLPVILMSGMAETDLARRSLGLRAVSYLVKPFAVGDLLMLIQLALA